MIRLDRITQDDLPVDVGPLRLCVLLGAGSVGRVFRAETSGVGGLPRVVAVTVLHPSDDPAAGPWGGATRLVPLAAKLRHPGIAQTYSWGENDGIPYVVTELLEGLGLDELVAKHGPLDPRNALDVGVQIAGALGAAHGGVSARAGMEGVALPHGDLRPSRVSVGPDGVVKLRGFGLATLAGRSAPGTFHAGTSPESLGGRPADRESDVFGLGALLGFALLGGPTVVVRRESTPAEHIATLARAIEGGSLYGEIKEFGGASLAGLVLRMMALDPRRRFPSVTDAEAAMRELRGSLQRGVRLAQVVQPYFRFSGESTRVAPPPKPLLTDEERPPPRPNVRAGAVLGRPEASSGSVSVGGVVGSTRRPAPVTDPGVPLQPVVREAPAELLDLEDVTTDLGERDLESLDAVPVEWPRAPGKLAPADRVPTVVPGSDGPPTEPGRAPRPAVPPAAAGSSPAAAAHAPRSTPAARPRRPRRPSRGVLLVRGLGAAVIVLGLGILLLQVVLRQRTAPVSEPEAVAENEAPLASAPAEPVRELVESAAVVEDEVGLPELESSPRAEVDPDPPPAARAEDAPRRERDGEGRSALLQSSGGPPARAREPVSAGSADVPLGVSHSPRAAGTAGSSDLITTRVQGPPGVRVVLHSGPAGGPYEQATLKARSGGRWEGWLDYDVPAGGVIEYWIVASHPSTTSQESSGSRGNPHRVVVE